MRRQHRIQETDQDLAVNQSFPIPHALDVGSGLSVHLDVLAKEHDLPVGLAVFELGDDTLTRYMGRDCVGEPCAKRVGTWQIVST